MRSFALIPVVAGMLSLQTAVAVYATAPPGEGPLFVWAGPFVTLDDVLFRADGYLVGPRTPFLGAFVHSQSPGLADRLRDAGAVIVLSHERLSRIGCRIT